MKKIFSLALLILTPWMIFAQNSAEATKGIDERINDWFEPIANAVADVVFTSFPVAGVDITVVVLLLVVGAFFFTIRFGFPNFRFLRISYNTVKGTYDNLYETVTGKKVTEPHGEISHFQALTAGLSGTVGLGNIAGVGVAIAIGGPGATFWIIIGGLVGMTVKFVECTLGVKYRDIDPDGTVHGGPMYYMKKGFKERYNKGKIGAVLGTMFAIFCVGASFGGGNAFQSNQVAQQIITTMDLKSEAAGFIIGCILAIVVGIVIIGGIKRIASWAEKIVPFMGIIYVLAGLIIIFMHWNMIDDAFALIINSAFSSEAKFGGFIGVLFIGFRRAAFSNEAGAGTSPIAHSAVKTKYPASEGFVGMLAPSVDTVIVCTMTALVIVFCGLNGSFDYGTYEMSKITLTSATGGFPVGSQLSGVSLTSAAFEEGIPHFGYVLTVAVVLFAFSTLISWSYYGIQAWKFLFGKSKASDLTYKVLFLLFVVAGGGATLDAVITFSDAMIFALVFPNMIGLFFLFPVVKEEMVKYLDAIKIWEQKKGGDKKKIAEE